MWAGWLCFKNVSQMCKDRARFIQVQEEKKCFSDILWSVTWFILFFYQPHITVQLNSTHIFYRPSSFLFVIVNLNCLDTVLTSMHWENNLLWAPAGGPGQGQMSQSVSYPLNSFVLSSLTWLVVFILPPPSEWYSFYLNTILCILTFGGGEEKAF